MALAPIKKKAPDNGKLTGMMTEEAANSFIAYYGSCQTAQNDFRPVDRQRMEKIDKAYQRQDADKTEDTKKSKLAHALGDTSRFRDITVPVVKPQVEAAVVYQSSVFLTGQPIFGVVAAPAYMDAAIQMETKIAADAERCGYTRELILFFRDCFKYNKGAVEVEWAQEVTSVPQTDVGANVSEATVKEVIWTGNKIKRINPYNIFYDRSCPLAEVYKHGEYAGYTEQYSRMKLKQLIAAMPDDGKLVTRIKPALESSIESGGTSTDTNYKGVYVPDVNPDVNVDNYNRGGTDWFAWADLAPEEKKKIDYKNVYEVTTLYCRVLPSEMNLRSAKENTPHIYKLIIVNHQHIIYFKEQTNAHSYLPILFGRSFEDGLEDQTKSFANDAEPFQQVTSAYMASILAARRRAIGDRVLYDPSRIDSAQINNPNPSAKIPVRPHAYGKNLNEAVYAFPYRDDQSAGAMQQMSALIGLANTLNGQNQARQGQFVKGNKTLHEYEDVMQNANGTDQLTAIGLEVQVFTPMKFIIKQNILQYQGGTKLYNKERDKEVEVDPIKLRTAVLEFKVSDGLIPSDKLANSDSLATALQVLGTSQQIAAEYNLGPLFSYFMKLQGAKITDFEKSQEQVAYEQALNAWQQTMQLAIQKGIDPKSLGVGEQPKPQDFNYNPKQTAPSPNSTGDQTNDNSGQQV